MPSSPHLAGVAKYGFAVSMLNVLVQTQAIGGLARTEASVALRTSAARAGGRRD
jgi:hypothetical protein